MTLNGTQYLSDRKLVIHGELIFEAGGCLAT